MPSVFGPNNHAGFNLRPSIKITLNQDDITIIKLSCGCRWFGQEGKGGARVTFPKQTFSSLRTFAPIVTAHPYCASNSRRHGMRRHALSACAVEEM